MTRRPPLPLALAGAALLLPEGALAQRTTDNAVTAADDAFGTSIGNEQIGIYNPSDVRGFSPVDAGNVRIEGVYFDQQADPTDRLVEGSTVRVGISAQGYPFPAPTGIADYALRKPGREWIASTVLHYGPFNGMSAELDAQLPIAGERFGVAVGAGFSRERNEFGGSPHYLSSAFVPVWRPRTGVEVIGFFGRIDFAEEETQTIVFPAGDYVPSRVRRGPYTGQPWADNRGHNQNYGAIAKASFGGFRIQAGLIRSERALARGFSDLLIGVTPDARAADRLIIADANLSFGSTSGELRVSRDFGSDAVRHTIHLLARGPPARTRARSAAALWRLGPRLARPDHLWREGLPARARFPFRAADP